MKFEFLWIFEKYSNIMKILQVGANGFSMQMGRQT
jgi:hypothetical protein